MKPPPLLLGAALVFWGWQTGLLMFGAIMAVIIEGGRLVKGGWDFSDEDFRRIWTFCSLLFLAVAVYVFTDNGGPAELLGMLQDRQFMLQRNAGRASSQTAASLLRWLPMIFFCFAAAQAYNSRDRIPLSTISLILRWRMKQAAKRGQTLAPARLINVLYPYFALCLFAASIHPYDDNPHYYWGLALLIACALWSQRSRRFGVVLWIGALAIALGLGFLGQRGVSLLSQKIQTLSPHWILAFLRRHQSFDPAQTKTSIGEIGTQKGSAKIVIRVRPRNGSAPPDYLREASYRRFRSPHWYIGGQTNDFETVSSPMENVFVLVGDKTNSSVSRITCFLSHRSRETGYPLGLLPLPTDSEKLENLPAYVLKRNSVGAVLAEGPRVLVFDARFGPGPVMDSAPGPEDLHIPNSERNGLDQIISEFQLRNPDTASTLRSLGAFFQEKFTYSLWQGDVKLANTNETHMSRFLLESRSGHCEYFASATVLLLRRMGIPARYVVGYMVHESSGREFVVRERDAHAWCLVWHEDTQSWQNFDTTPGTWIEAEKARESSLQWLADAWSWITLQFSKVRWGQSNVREYLLIGVLPILLFLLYRAFFRRKGRKRGREGEAELIPDWPGLDSEFYQIEKKLAARGLVRLPGEPLSDWLQRALADPALATAGDPLRQLLRLHYRYRFDPRSLSRSERKQLASETRACLEQLTVAFNPKG